MTGTTKTTTARQFLAESRLQPATCNRILAGQTLWSHAAYSLHVEFAGGSVLVSPRQVMSEGVVFRSQFGQFYAPSRARSLESRKKASKSGRFWTVLDGFSTVSTTNSSCSEAMLLKRKKGDLQWLMSIQPNCLQPSSGPANRHVRPLFRLPHKPTSVGSPGFDDCADSLARATARASFSRAHLERIELRPNCRSARQKSRDGVTGGSGLGSAVLGSRDLVRIVARSRETGTLGSTVGFEPQISW